MNLTLVTRRAKPKTAKLQNQKASNTMSQKDPNTIVLMGRLSYPSLHEPSQMNDDSGKPTGEPKYSCAVLIDKTTGADQLKRCKEIIKNVCAAEWKGKTVKLKDGKVLSSGTDGNIVLMGIALRDGVEKDDKEGYGDSVMFVSASSKNKPAVVQKVNGAFADLPKDSGKPYAGCNVAVSVRFWAQDNQYGKRVNAELRSVLFTGDNTPFGSAPVNVEEEFEDVELPEETTSSAPAAASDDW